MPRHGKLKLPIRIDAMPTSGAGLESSTQLMDQRGIEVPYRPLTAVVTQRQGDR